jgi:hypothetical protein
MRLNNRNKIGYFQFLSTFVVTVFLLGMFLFFVEHYFYKFLDSAEVLLIVIPTLIIVIFYLRGRQIFEYDSDGEALNFKNKNVVLFLDKPLSDEFPKYKLKSYEIVNVLILKRLYVTISSKKSNAIILKYDISYLSKKELNDLKLSLSKVTENNKTNNS